MRYCVKIKVLLTLGFKERVLFIGCTDRKGSKEVDNNNAKIFLHTIYCNGMYIWGAFKGPFVYHIW